MNPVSLFTHDPKEAILHFLRSSASYGWRHIPLLETVQFLRSRRIPAHQLHDVTFQDTEGQLWGFRFLLCRSSDESWSVIEYSGNRLQSDRLPAKLSTNSDRPWLQLAGSSMALQETAFPGGEELLQEVWKTLEGLRATSEGQEKAQAFQQALQERLRTTPEEEKIREVRKTLQAFQQASPEKQEVQEEQQSPFHHFFAYGEVIDHGFDITRIRLASSNGLVFEDTVEEGLVLFASHQKVPRPLQAELYNRSGELVCRQTVLDPFPFPPDPKFGGFFRPAS